MWAAHLANGGDVLLLLEEVDPDRLLVSARSGCGRMSRIAGAAGLWFGMQTSAGAAAPAGQKNGRELLQAKYRGQIA